MKTSTAIQDEIDAMEVQLEPMNLELDQLYRDFIAALPPYVEKWMRTAISRNVEQRAEQVNSAGIEPLRLLKAELAEIVASLPDLCAEAVGPSNSWPHRKEMTTVRKSPSEYSSESHAAASFRKAIAPVGALLAKHRMLEQKTGIARDWEPVGQGKYKYVFNPGFEEREFPSLVRYKERQAVQKNQLNLIELKRQELVKAKARELWDEA